MPCRDAVYLEGSAVAVPEYLAAADYSVGCPAASLVLDGLAATPELQRLCHDALDTWHGIIDDGLRAAGSDPARSASLATFILSAEEGAMHLCRARRSREPLRQAVDHLGRLLDPVS